MVGRSGQLQRKGEGEDLVGIGGTVDSLAKELICISPLPWFNTISEPCLQGMISAPSEAEAREASACFASYSEQKKKRGGGGEKKGAPVKLMPLCIIRDNLADAVWENHLS